MSERTVLVTGAAGFVGGYVLDALRGRGRRVLGLVRSAGQGEKLRALGAELVVGDLTDADSLVPALEGVDEVIHLAAVNRDRGEATMERVNYHGTINLLAAAKKQGVERLVYVIGIGADPRRSSPLSHTQGKAAEAIMASGLTATVIESGVIYGHGDAFGTMLTGLARLAPLVVVPGNGRARFEPISVRDVAEAAVNSLDSDEVANRRIEIGGPDVLTLDEIYDLLLQAAGLKRLKLHLPVPLLRPFVPLMERFLPEPPVTSALLSLLELDILTHHNALRSLLSGPPQVFAENLAYVREVTAGRFLNIVLGRSNRRAEIGTL